MTDGIPHPFEIFWDAETASYYIFVPDGCVMVDGRIAHNDDAANGNLALDFPEGLPEKVYCHVAKDADSGWTFFFDGEPDAEGASYSFIVSSFGADENDGESYDVVKSAISLGGGAESLPRCFDLAGWTEHDPEAEGDEPTFSPTVVRRYYRVGGRTRELSDAETPSGAAGEWAGAILAVKFDLQSGVGPSGSLVRYNSLVELQAGENNMDCYILPLYQFGEDGRSVAVDLRTALNAQMTEV